MIDKFMGNRIRPFEFRDHIRISDHQGGRTITEPHFIKISGLGFTAIGSGYHDIVSFTAFNRVQGDY